VSCPTRLGLPVEGGWLTVSGSGVPTLALPPCGSIPFGGAGQSDRPDSWFPVILDPTELFPRLRRGVKGSEEQEMPKVPTHIGGRFTSPGHALGLGNNPVGVRDDRPTEF
jgi:hypothetical protein